MKILIKGSFQQFILEITRNYKCKPVSVFRLRAHDNVYVVFLDEAHNFTELLRLPLKYNGAHGQCELLAINQFNDARWFFPKFRTPDAFNNPEAKEAMKLVDEATMYKFSSFNLLADGKKFLDMWFLVRSSLTEEAKKEIYLEAYFTDFITAATASTLGTEIKIIKPEEKPKTGKYANHSISCATFKKIPNTQINDSERNEFAAKISETLSHLGFNTEVRRTANSDPSIVIDLDASNPNYNVRLTCK